MLVRTSYTRLISLTSASFALAHILKVRFNNVIFEMSILDGVFMLLRCARRGSSVFCDSWSIMLPFASFTRRKKHGVICTGISGVIRLIAL